MKTFVMYSHEHTAKVSSFYEFRNSRCQKNAFLHYYFDINQHLRRYCFLFVQIPCCPVLGVFHLETGSGKFVTNLV